MKGIQLVGIIVALYLLVQIYINYRRKNYSFRRALFFSLLWIVVLLLFAYPPLAELALPFLSTKDVIMSVLVIGIIILFLLISEIYQQIGKIEKRVEILVQNLAIEDYLKGVISENKDDEK